MLCHTSKMLRRVVFLQPNGSAVDMQKHARATVAVENGQELGL